jgi:uncharacterized protein
MVRINVEPKQQKLFCKVMALMLELGQDVNVQNKSGETPLHQASLEGRTYAIDWLLKNGANPHLTNKYSETPLHFACRSGVETGVSLLLEFQADPNAHVQ